MSSKMPTMRLENAAASVSRCRAPARNMDRDWVKTGWPDAECRAKQGFGGEVHITEAGQSFSRVLCAYMQDRWERK